MFFSTKKLVHCMTHLISSLFWSSNISINLSLQTKISIIIICVNIQTVVLGGGGWGGREGGSNWSFMNYYQCIDCGAFRYWKTFATMETWRGCLFLTLLSRVITFRLMLKQSFHENPLNWALTNARIGFLANSKPISKLLSFLFGSVSKISQLRSTTKKFVSFV